MSVEEHRREAPAGAVGFAVITVSDSRTGAEDRSGPLARDLVVVSGHRVERTQLIHNEVVAIQEVLRGLLTRRAVDAILFLGGTGLSARDVTVEAVRPLLERPIEGFGEIFRALSYAEIGAAAMLSRASAGIAHRRAIFVLPGSPAAIELALTKLILPEIAHLLGQAGKS